MANLLPTVDISGTVIFVYDILMASRNEKKQIFCIMLNVYFFTNL